MTQFEKLSFFSGGNLLRIARLRSDLCNSYEKNGVKSLIGFYIHPYTSGRLG